MRFTVVGLIVSLVLLSSPLEAQEVKPVPKDSVRVTVPGCTKGRVFTAGPKTEDQPGRSDIPEGMHLRMNGQKKLMADIREHEGQTIQITGLMKRGQYLPGIPVGGGVRISPGAAPTVSGVPSPMIGSTIYIDVESWQPAPGECHR